MKIGIDISGAQIFLPSSFYEGFGISSFEAMASGVPVLRSRTSSIPEVAGKAAFYVGPYEVTSILLGRVTLAQKEGLRKEWVQKGLGRGSGPP